VASVHPRFHTPHVAIALQAALTCALAVTSTFEGLAVLANLSVLLLYGACSLAAWRLRRLDVRTGGVPFRVPAAGVVSAAACLVILWLLTGARPEEWTAIAAALAAATLLFLLTARSRRSRQK
jgi:amino acid transporter